MEELQRAEASVELNSPRHACIGSQARSRESRPPAAGRSAALNTNTCCASPWSLIWTASRIPARAYKRKIRGTNCPRPSQSPQRVRGRGKWRAGRAGTRRSRGGGGGGCGRRASRGRDASRCPPPTRTRRLTAPARGRASPSPRIWLSRSMGSSEGDLSAFPRFLPLFCFVISILLLSLVHELKLCSSINSTNQVSCCSVEFSAKIIDFTIVFWLQTSARLNLPFFVSYADDWCPRECSKP